MVNLASMPIQNNTKFSEVQSRVDFIELEHKILDYWKTENTFQKLVKKNKGKPKWSFLDGPITANNPMGVHHAWGRTLKDIYQRYHAMLGKELRYQNGFDCQGLWVEVEVEKELGFKSKRDIEKYGIAKPINNVTDNRDISSMHTDISTLNSEYFQYDLDIQLQFHFAHFQ